ncbi:hypothetical protein QTO34_018634 [Cnephaeus nilssonii]|uniref:Uncharacterized protein n=1 Tax=Cnephaeus nilssonii TaxID=3371016 RepID=A0AA40I008_CNENI|nr:hypothetical protein QTO34_018634 [Eptesicus nilssonii]
MVGVAGAWLVGVACECSGGHGFTRIQGPTASPGPGARLTRIQGPTASPGPGGQAHPDPGAHGLTRIQGPTASPGPGGRLTRILGPTASPGPGARLTRIQGPTASPGPGARLTRIQGPTASPGPGALAGSYWAIDTNPKEDALPTRPKKRARSVERASTPYSIDSDSLGMECIISGSASPTLAINTVTNKPCSLRSHVLTTLALAPLTPIDGAERLGLVPAAGVSRAVTVSGFKLWLLPHHLLEQREVEKPSGAIGAGSCHSHLLTVPSNWD